MLTPACVSMLFTPARGQLNLKTKNKTTTIADYIFSWKADLKYIHNVLAYQP